MSQLAKVHQLRKKNAAEVRADDSGSGEVGVLSTPTFNPPATESQVKSEQFSTGELRPAAFNVETLFSGEDLYTRTPFYIWQTTGLNMTEKAVLSMLVFHHGENGRIYPSIDLLTHNLGTSRSSVKRALEGLRKKNFITWERPSLPKRREGIANDYQIIWETVLALRDDCKTETSRFKMNPVQGSNWTLYKVQNEPPKQQSLKRHYKQQQQGGGCGENLSPENQNPPATGGQFTDDQKRYADHVTDKAWQAGEVKKTKGAYRKGVLARIAAGEVDQKDIDDVVLELSRKEQRELLASHVRVVEAMTGDKRREYFKKVVRDTGKYGLTVEDVGNNEVMFSAYELKKALNVPAFTWELEDIINNSKVDMEPVRRERALRDVTMWDGDKVVNFIVEYVNYPDTSVRFGSNGDSVFVSAGDIVETFKDSHPSIYADYAAGKIAVNTPVPW